ncbi:MAG: 2-thiouracil desulfurase family protein [Acidobacteriota bacterium]
MVDVLVERLRDRRSRKVAFVSHCLLNENTRYLGGACRACCVREVVNDLLDRDIGIVQMPCPEQLAWGGVRKRHMLRLYGHARAARLAGIARAYSRFAFRRLARRIAAQIADYVESGFTVEAVIGVDGSPSCGVATNVEIRGAVRDIAVTDPEELTIDEQNALVRRHLAPGRGLFIEELQRELRRRSLDVPFRAHDLIDELDGLRSHVG